MTTVSKIIFLLLSIWCLSAEAQDFEEEYIKYTVNIKSSNEIKDCDDFKDQISDIGRLKWLFRIFNELKNGQRKAFQYNTEASHEDVFLYPLSYKEIIQILQKTDTIYIYTPEYITEQKPYIIQTNLDIERINKILFLEKWTNTKEKGIVKKIIAYAPVIDDFSEMGDFLGERILFWLKPDALYGQSENLIITEVIEYKMPIKDSANYLLSNKWLNNILEDVKKGQRMCYNKNWFVEETDEPQEELKKEDIYNIFNKSDSIYFPSLDNPDILELKVLNTIYTPNQIEFISFREQWILHPIQGMMKERIAFSPILSDYRVDGSYYGYKRLFWLK